MLYNIIKDINVEIAAVINSGDLLEAELNKAKSLATELKEDINKIVYSA